MGQVPKHPGNEFIQQYAGSFQKYIPGHGEVQMPSPVMLAEAEDEKEGGSFQGYIPAMGEAETHGQVPLGPVMLPFAPRSADGEKTGSHVPHRANWSDSWAGSGGRGDLNSGPDQEYMKHGMHLGRTKGNMKNGSNAHRSEGSSQQSFDYQKYMQGSGQAGSDGTKDASQQSFDYQKYMQGSGQAGSDGSKDSSQQSFDYQKYMQGSGQAQKFMHGPQKPAIADAYKRKDSSQQSVDHQHGSGKMRSTARSTESEKVEDAEQHLAKAEAARKRAAREIEAAKQAAEADAASKRADLERKEYQEGQVVKHAEDRVKHAEDMVKRAKAARKQEGVRHDADHKKEHAAENERESKQNFHDQPKASTFLAAGHSMKSQYLVPALFFLLTPDPLSCATLAALACSVSYCVRSRRSQAAQPGILEESLLPQEDTAI
eukprot:CAMPEP_0197621860 /NCGR_PEP_ID=MMETSP1338-20131121/2295_1 /TAXON_ID=43686 ORGANISM="Pelagodinium beii, Strain RCC1491" /NCGR_SAMPLE_ID=MMETSP1338 /ASSEMBLY_ACC=CAM_ASM_000754 /LENGTH=429 /DNA_ID=CAMNT_0043191419 /DNA_START=124 /DNA_END=1413 /DNA_ORIENTATION=+